MAARAFLMLKPDGVAREKEVMAVLDRHFAVVASRSFPVAPAKRLAALYAEHEGKPFHPWLMAALKDRPLKALLLAPRRRMGAAALHRLLDREVGDTDPKKAAPGTVRALSDDDMTVSMRNGRAVRNLVHRSRTAAETEREAALFFFDTAGPGEAEIHAGPATLALASPLGAARPLPGVFLGERLEAALGDMGLLGAAAELAAWEETRHRGLRVAAVTVRHGGRRKTFRLVLDGGT